jgi:fructose transport system substrate-binding protein
MDIAGRCPVLLLMPFQGSTIRLAAGNGDAGILITPNGPSVVDAITSARDAGLYVIALDTPPDPADAVDITFATDNRLAGQKIGAWTAGALDGEKATIAMLDLFADKVITVDVDRDQGFLEGMGIDVADPAVNGDEAATGDYDGGTYEIVGHEATTVIASPVRRTRESAEIIAERLVLGHDWRKLLLAPQR